MKKNCSNTTLKELIEARVKFCEARNWNDGLNNSKSILLALTSELGELTDIYAWKDQYWVPKTEEEKKQAIFEMVDVFNYLGALISQIKDVDFCELYFEKMEKLAKKYPIGADDEVYDKNREEYRKTGKNKLYED
jgi:hypothetical protein